eukprot:scpid72266/ scgid28191/ 
MVQRSDTLARFVVALSLAVISANLPACRASFSQVMDISGHTSSDVTLGISEASRSGSHGSASATGRGAAAAGAGMSVADAQDTHRGTTFFLGARYAVGLLTDEEKCALQSAKVTVLSGDSDNIGMLLRMIGVNYTLLDRSSSEEDVRNALHKEQCRVAFVNAGTHLLNEDVAGKKTVLVARFAKRLLKVGGTLVTTDDAVRLLDQAPFRIPKDELPLKHKPFRGRTNIRLARTHYNESDEAISDNACLRDRKVIEVVTTLTELLNRFESTSRWHLAPTSKVVRRRRRKIGKAPTVFSLLRSDDLPSRWDSILSCGNNGKGLFWHVTGPLAQTFPTHRNGKSGMPLTRLLLYMFLHNDMLELSPTEETFVLNTIATLSGLGMPLIVEDVAAAAISSTWLARFVLQSWREDRACMPTACRSRCEQSHG